MPENKGYPVYSATKWALTGYTKALASRFAGTSIKVTSLHPGPIDSHMPQNAGGDWGSNHDWLMSTVEVANTVIYAINSPGKVQVGSIEFKKTNWNQ